MTGLKIFDSGLDGAIFLPMSQQWELSVRANAWPDLLGDYPDEEHVTLLEDTAILGSTFCMRICKFAKKTALVPATCLVAVRAFRKNATLDPVQEILQIPYTRTFVT